MDRWENQEEAYKFAMTHPAVMLDMEMGTGKTRVAIDVAMDRLDVSRVLVVCPKAVLSVWPKELAKYRMRSTYGVCVRKPGNLTKEAKRVKEFITPRPLPGVTKFVIVNYDSVWRRDLGEIINKTYFDMIILDESHRAKSAGSKVSRFLAMLGKKTKYKMCLSGTPMANSPLDVYGQYRFLDPTVFGTNYSVFLQEYAIMGGPEKRFIVGYKNQKKLHEKFDSLAYSCSMRDVSQRLKLPESLPPITWDVELPNRDMKTLRELSKDFIAECSTGNMIVLNSVLTRALRMQQIAAGFCLTQDGPGSESVCEELNTAKADVLEDYLVDLNPQEQVVVFCQFKHDLDTIKNVTDKCSRASFELSGRKNELEDWRVSSGGVLAVQIQAGAEGVDMTCSNHAIYFTLPHSLALYEQSKARLYRPGQAHPVSFVHLIANGTIDELMYQSLVRKRNLIDAVKEGILDYGILKK